MFINATGSEFQGFNPANAGLSLPPIGIYPNLKMQIATSLEGMTKAVPAQNKPAMNKLDVTFDILSGQLEGTQFKLTYNTGHHNPQTASIAIKSLLSLVYAITGIDWTGKQFNFDAGLYNKPFTGTLEVTPQAEKDNSGNPYRNANLKSLKPFDPNQQPAQAPQATAYQNTNYAPQQNQPAQNAGGTPPWAQK